jgi:hypothetical protein
MNKEAHSPEINGRDVTLITHLHLASLARGSGVAHPSSTCLRHVMFNQLGAMLPLPYFTHTVSAQISQYVEMEHLYRFQDMHFNKVSLRELGRHMFEINDFLIETEINTVSAPKRKEQSVSTVVMKSYLPQTRTCEMRNQQTRNA